MSLSSDNQICIAYCNTSGLVEAFETDTEGEVYRSLFSTHVEVENPVTGSLGTCAANSLSLISEGLVVAADDGTIRLASMEGTWIAKARQHNAAVVKVIGLCHHDCLLSLGADHRLVLWRLADGPSFTVLSELTMTGIGDPQDFTVVTMDENRRSYLAMVSGSGLQLCSIRMLEHI
ncbi:unnamed protein product [Mesocestoides corti]|uniref:WD_REPEATS_REGION domain-containing protein n=1 Tax=Mesocestoides corti TaxID=53468 RepID=A0A0R3UHL3_MESCO|nr:unnamed protein product [Mesocestoides corti]